MIPTIPFFRKPQKVAKLSDDERQILERFLTPDIMLYNYFRFIGSSLSKSKFSFNARSLQFSRRFEERIAAYGTERMKQDVAKLKDLNEKLREDCVIEESDRYGNKN